MKITHPVDGYTGYVRVGDHGLRFLAGVAHEKLRDLGEGNRKVLEAEGFTVEDDRPGRGASDGE